MWDRANHICDCTSKQPELRDLQDVFQANGIPEDLVKKMFSHQPRPSPAEPASKVPLKHLCLPYVKGLSEKVGRVCIPLGVKAAFKPMKTMRQTLMKVKTCIPEEKKRAIVYEVPCKDCNKTYILGRQKGC